MKPMTDDQIEAEITQAHANLIAEFSVAKTERECDRAATRSIRAAFTLGQDNGRALMLRSVEEMIVQRQVADEQTKQLGRSVAALIAWTRCGSNRSWHAHGPTKAAGCYAVAWFLDGNNTLRNYFVHEASDEAEALSKLAAWCTDQTRDTEPPAAEPTQPNNEAPEAP